MGFEQLTSLRFPSEQERAIAIMRLSPSQLSDRTGIVFASVQDELSPFQEAAIKLRSGEGVWLVQRPGYAIDVSVDSRTDLVAALKEVVESLALEDGEYESLL